MSRPKIPLYVISVFLFMLFLPILCISVQWKTQGDGGWVLIGKWFIFWALGVRLFIAGLRQVSKPAFTAKEIFHFDGKESFPVIRELGFSNICLGLLSMLSIEMPGWCAPAAFAGGLYFGFAGFLHVFKKIESRNEAIALISDLFIFIVMALYLIFTLIIK